MPSSATSATFTLSLHDALPIYAKGYTVQGSDQMDSANVKRLRAKGIRVFVGHDPVNLVGARYIVVSTAIKRSNPELEAARAKGYRSEEHTSELQSLRHLVCRLLRRPRPSLFPYTTLFRSTPRATPSKAATRWTAPTSSACAPRAFACSSATTRSTWSERAISSSRPPSSAAIPSSRPPAPKAIDRKSTRLNSSHLGISYAVFCDVRDLHSFPTRRSSDLRQGLHRPRQRPDGQRQRQAPARQGHSRVRRPRPGQPGRSALYRRLDRHQAQQSRARGRPRQRL